MHIEDTIDGIPVVYLTPQEPVINPQIIFSSPEVISLKPDKPGRIRKRGHRPMTYYLVDLENVGYNCIKTIRNADVRDSKFFIYYTVNTNLTRVEFWLDMMTYSKKGYYIEFVKCPAGPQAADKIILADLGVLAGKNAYRDYVIISNDKGYYAGVDRVCALTHANIQVHSVMHDADDEED